LNEKVKVVAVSYLNTKPLVYGFKQGMMSNEMELIFDIPSRASEKLMNNEVDLGLIPVAAIPDLKEYYIISDYCIGATNPVASVCLFSEVPIEEIDSIILDYQSKTSVALLKILLKEYWNIQPLFINSEHEFHNEIKDNTAGLIIGDRALVQLNNFKYVYDLAEVWQLHTGLPFVFAAWVSNKKLSDDFVFNFNDVIKFSLTKMDEISKEINFSYYDLDKYYHYNLDYKLDEQKLRALELFWQKLKTID
jgi:chorismate dehydratase